jgi:hypothetical protein
LSKGQDETELASIFVPLNSNDPMLDMEPSGCAAKQTKEHRKIPALDTRLSLTIFAFILSAHHLHCSMSQSAG